MPGARSRLDQKTPEYIGRFQVIGVLGEGAQGKVFLGTDHKLGRQVAIKVIVDDAEDAIIGNGQLLNEARIASRFQHPHVVSIYECGEDAELTFVVMEYVKGKTLEEMMDRDAGFDLDFVLTLTDQLLDALTMAHKNQLVHSDLKPGNIILDENMHARILDFGIARYVSGRTEDGLIGTPKYMAPEYIKDGELGTVADVFALGLIIYSLLTARPAISATTESDIFEEILEKNFTPPSHFNSQISEELDEFVARALNRDPDQRYQDAGEMREALTSVRPARGADDVSVSPTSTVQFLLRRMQRHQDFPALSDSIINLNRLFASENESASSIANVICQDFALTNKLLRVVNSAYYSRMGGRISTISRAVVTLGFRTIKDMAASLLLVDKLQNKSQARRMRDQLLGSLYSAVIARKMASRVAGAVAEDAFLAGLFNQLGRLLTLQYLHEESEEIDQSVAQGKDPEMAQSAVLGTTFDRLGETVAKHWRFAPDLIAGMGKLDVVGKPKQLDKIEKLQAIAGFANDYCQAAESGDAGEIQLCMSKFTSRLGTALGIKKKDLKQIVLESHEEFGELVEAIGVDTRRSALLAKLKKLNKGSSDITCRITALDKELKPLEGALLDHTKSGIDGPENAEQSLAQGIQDISQSMAEGATAGDILRMILETIYRSLDFDRVLFCLKDGRRNEIVGRYGFGSRADEMLEKFAMPCDYRGDVFGLAMHKALDVLIHDSFDDKIRGKIPSWHAQISNAGAFAIFPLCNRGSAVGMIYAECDKAISADQIDDQTLSLMKTLRNQAVIALSSSSS